MSEVSPAAGAAFQVQGSRFNIDEIVKSARSVIPGPGSSPGQAFLTRNPELIEITGFPLQFTPDLIRGGNDKKREIRTFYETINIAL
ncbi:MAG: hypothetical protein K9L59_16640 [Desulfobacterales bacterium]|nr:hypothetical protein [Desulfobacterales bacterium]